MRNTNAPSTAGQLRLKNHPAFSVILAYDKYADGIRAKEFFDGSAVDSHLAVQITNPTSGGTAELINGLVKRAPTQSLTKV